MTSRERHEVRYQRRKAKREQRKIDRCREVGGLSRVFTYKALFKAGKACCNGVRWKNSTQRFELHLFSTTAKVRRLLFEKRWEQGKYVNFTLRERGKVRPISAPRIQDRQVHKTLTRGALLPLYLPDMIYNNGASLPGKGFHFSRRLLCEDLRWHYRHYGREGNIILMDFKKFFPTASHEVIYARHKKLLKHPNIRELADKITASSPSKVGLPLGVEASQAEMIALPCPLDNYVKCQLSIKGFGHYMDDYYIIVPPDIDAVELLEKIIAKASEYGITVNRKKTHIQPLTKPFKYCKAKYTLTETGKVYVNGCRDSVKRARRKFKTFHKRYESGEMLLSDIDASVQGILAYFKSYDDHNRVLRLNRLLYSLFGFSFEKKKTNKEDFGLCDMWFTDDFVISV